MSGKWKTEAASDLRRSIFLYAWLAVLIFAGCKLPGQSSLEQPRVAAKPIIDKHPVNFSSRTFDPSNPPPDMPPLPSGEVAECDTDFQSNASVGGKSFQTDATHATLTVTRVTVTLDLIITIWVPTDATQHVIEHENGHRQISEYYYRTAGNTAEQIAAAYWENRYPSAARTCMPSPAKRCGKWAPRSPTSTTRRSNPGPTQLLYDTITDHSRNEVDAREAVDHAIKNAAIEAN